MVNTEIDIVYSWNKNGCFQLILLIKHKMTFEQQLYRINDMSLAMKVQLYECCSDVEPSIVVCVDDKIFKIQN